MSADLAGSWAQLWATLGAHTSGPEVLEELVAAYRQPHRRYHTLDHVANCLTTFEHCRDLAAEPDLIALALWAHDVVYDPKANDNEAQSSLWISTRLAAGGVGPARLAILDGLIRATRHDSDPAPGDAALIASIDLGILATPWPQYAAYAYAIRCEYGWVDDSGFRAGRAAVLRNFLERRPLFPHPAFREQDALARQNLARELSWYTRSSAGPS